MKKLLLLILTFLFTLVLTTTCFADSPLTSTEFSQAYKDINMVNKAYQGTMTPEIADYLTSSTNSIDKKAAVINALGFDLDGQKNAEIFSNLVFKTSVDKLDIISLKPEDAFCIGYLLAMDDYFNPEVALPFLDRAQAQMKDSFTIAIIHALIEAQITDDFDDMWAIVEKVVNNTTLKQDMRRAGIAIIVDYMISYSETPILNQFADKNIIKLYTNSSEVQINSAEYFDGFGIDGILEIKNNNVFMKIEPLIKLLGGTTSWDNKQKKMTIIVNGKKIELWIDKKVSYVNGVKKTLAVTPYISKSNNMIPLKFVSETLGYKFKWNKNLKQVVIEVPNSTKSDQISGGKGLSYIQILTPKN